MCLISDLFASYSIPQNPRNIQKQPLGGVRRGNSQSVDGEE